MNPGPTRDEVIEALRALGLVADKMLQNPNNHGAGVLRVGNAPTPAGTTQQRPLQSLHTDQSWQTPLRRLLLP
eukprot:8434837-Pyramimonas_sp.AAC.1